MPEVGSSDDEKILLLLKGLGEGVKNSELSGGQETVWSVGMSRVL